MSTHAAPLERARSLRLRLLLSADVVAPLALGAFSLVLILLTWNTWGNPANDTGYDMLAGSRVAHGELPYLDFTYYYGPLPPFAVGLAALIGGSGMWPSIVLGLVIALAIVFAVYILARGLGGPMGAFLAGGLTAAVAFSPNTLSFVNPHTFSATLGVLTTLCFLICLQRFASAQSQAWLVAAGAVLGLICLTRFEFALAALAAGFVWMLLRVRAHLAGRREVLMFAAPAVAVPAVVYGAFLSAVSVHTLLFENLYPRDFLNQAGDAVLKIRAPWTLSSFVTLGGKLVIYVVGVGVVLVVARVVEKSPRLRRALPVALIVVGLLVLAASVADPEALRHGLKFAYAWIPAGAGAAAVVLIVRGWRAGRSWSPLAQTELTLTVVLAIAAATCYAAFYIEAFRPQMAVYVLPLAAPFLTRLHLGVLARDRSAALLWSAWLVFLVAATAGLALKDASADDAVIRGPGGAIAAPSQDAAVYRSVINAIESGSAKGDPILVAPQLTWLYPMTERKDPLPELSLLPGTLPAPADEQRAIRQLEDARVRLVVIDTHPFVDYGHGSFGVTFDRRLARWIHSNFTRVNTFKGGTADSPHIEIWSRRGAS